MPKNKGHPLWQFEPSNVTLLICDSNVLRSNRIAFNFKRIISKCFLIAGRDSGF